MNRNDNKLVIDFDDSEWIRVRDRLRGRTSDWRPAARLIHAQMRVRVDSVFAKNARGGSHRGINWNYFSSQYTRKTDGAVVPAWGGTAKLRTDGVVLGRLRPSGQRVREGDSIGQDTGHLRRAALLSRRLDKRRLVMGSNVAYAEHFSAIRPLAEFHLPPDLRMMRQIIIDHFESG